MAFVQGARRKFDDDDDVVVGVASSSHQKWKALADGKGRRHSGDGRIAQTREPRVRICACVFAHRCVDARRDTAQMPLPDVHFGFFAVWAEVA